MRALRQNAPDTVYHVISRFVGGEWFIETDKHREHYLFLLGRALDESDWKCLAYAVMSNHIHLAMIAGEASLKSWITRVHTPFAQWINDTRKRIGPVFTRGPKDFAVRPENEGKLIAYIHNNPVRAGVAARARQSNWTSHRAYVGDAPAPEWLHVDIGLERAGFASGEELDAWVDVTPGESSKAELGRVRKTARLRGALEVATPTGGDVVTVPLIARSFAHLRPDPRRVVQLTAEVLGLSEVELCSRRRAPIIVRGRRIVAKCAKAIGISGADAAAALAVSSQSISRCMLRPIGSDRSVCELVLERMQRELAAGRR